MHKTIEMVQKGGGGQVEMTSAFVLRGWDLAILTDDDGGERGG